MDIAAVKAAVLAALQTELPTPDLERSLSGDRIDEVERLIHASDDAHEEARERLAALEIDDPA